MIRWICDVWICDVLWVQNRRDGGARVQSRWARSSEGTRPRCPRTLRRTQVESASAACSRPRQHRLRWALFFVALFEVLFVVLLLSYSLYVCCYLCNRPFFPLHSPLAPALRESGPISLSIIRKCLLVYRIESVKEALVLFIFDAYLIDIFIDSLSLL